MFECSCDAMQVANDTLELHFHCWALLLLNGEPEVKAQLVS